MATPLYPAALFMTACWWSACAAGVTRSVSSPCRGARIRGLGGQPAPALISRLSDVRADALLQDELTHPSLFWLNRRLEGREAPRWWPSYTTCVVRGAPAWQNSSTAWSSTATSPTTEGFVFNTERLGSRSGVGRGRQAIVLAYPGADRLPRPNPTAAATRASERGPLRVLFIGNVIPRKGLTPC